MLSITVHHVTGMFESWKCIFWLKSRAFALVWL